VAGFLESSAARPLLDAAPPAQRNALTPEVVAALRQALARADADRRRGVCA